MGFGDSFGGRGNGPQQTHAVRLAVVVGFFLMSLVAIGIPFLASKPATVVPAAAPPQEVVQLLEVFVPVQRVTPGTPLTSAMFQKEAMSLASVAALGGQPIKTIGEIDGRVAKIAIVPGRVLMADQVMDAPDYLLSKKIQPGYRAITIQLDNVAGIEGWGVPGSKVDVLWYSDSKQSDAVVTTIVKKVEVLSVQGRMNLNGGQQQGYVPLSSPNTEKSFTVTLRVSPSDGQKIFLASRSGELSLMLNGEFDSIGEEAGPEPLTKDSLIDRFSAVKAADPDDKVQGVVKAKRADGSVDEWSVIQGRVWRWDQGRSSTWAE
jgi:Flp pilus assembly protein CpaB